MSCLVKTAMESFNSQEANATVLRADLIPTGSAAELGAIDAQGTGAMIETELLGRHGRPG